MTEGTPTMSTTAHNLEAMRDTLVAAHAPDRVLELWDAMTISQELMGVKDAWAAMRGASDDASFLWLMAQAEKRLTTHAGREDLVLDACLLLLSGAQVFSGRALCACGSWVSKARAARNNPLKAQAALTGDAAWRCKTLAERLLTNEGAGRLGHKSDPEAVSEAMLDILNHRENQDMNPAAKGAVRAFLEALGEGSERAQTRALIFGGILATLRLEDVQPGGRYEVQSFRPKWFQVRAPVQVLVRQDPAPTVAQWVQVAILRLLPSGNALFTDAPDALRVGLSTAVFTLACAASGDGPDYWATNAEDDPVREMASLLLWNVPEVYQAEARREGMDLSEMYHMGLETGSGRYNVFRDAGGSLNPLADGSIHKELAHAAHTAILGGV